MAKRWLFAPLLAAAIAGPAAFIDDGKKDDSNSSDTTVQAWLTGNSTESEGNAYDSSGSIDSSRSFRSSGSFVNQAQSASGEIASLPAGMSADGVLYNDEAAMLDRNSILYAPGALDLREAFRFDATPEWMEQNWPTVSSIQSLDGLQGYRVPFVSGPNATDITGALSYYFNHKGKTERITFYGFSDDPSRVAQLATGHFRMSLDQSLGSGVYTGRYARTVRNLLAVQPESQSTLERRFQVTLEVNNPQGRYQLSPEATRMVIPANTRNASFRR